MSDLRNKLIRLGNNNPDLRKHLKEILNEVTKTSSVNGLAPGSWEVDTGQGSFRVEEIDSDVYEVSGVKRSEDILIELKSGDVYNIDFIDSVNRKQKGMIQNIMIELFG